MAVRGSRLNDFNNFLSVGDAAFSDGNYGDSAFNFIDTSRCSLASIANALSPQSCTVTAIAILAEEATVIVFLDDIQKFFNRHGFQMRLIAVPF